jgi:tRNA (cytidine/uridine-2'-O-)-methyltransferase
MLHVALLEPQIAPNTGNIARLCAATGARLHLIGRLGFRLDDRSLKRAGVDYWEHVDWARHAEWSAFAEAMGTRRLWLFTARGGTPYTTAVFAEEDCLIFGNEADGLPESLLDRYRPQVLHIPMPSGSVRSLNLATAVGIGLYEALRQVGMRDER